jgi:hypothetical protein
LALGFVKARRFRRTASGEITIRNEFRKFVTRPLSTAQTNGIRTWKLNRRFLIAAIVAGTCLGILFFADYLRVQKVSSDRVENRNPMPDEKTSANSSPRRDPTLQYSGVDDDWEFEREVSKAESDSGFGRGSLSSNSLIQRVSDFKSKNLENLTVDGDRLQLGSDATDETPLEPYKFFGVYTSPEFEFLEPCDSIVGHCASEQNSGTKLTAEFRVASVVGEWSEWEDLQSSDNAKPRSRPIKFLQYRLTLSGQNFGDGLRFENIQFQAGRGLGFEEKPLLHAEVMNQKER